MFGGYQKIPVSNICTFLFFYCFLSPINFDDFICFLTHTYVFLVSLMSGKVEEVKN